jgi:enoyl-CoA hydratase/carnithine racemase
MDDLRVEVADGVMLVTFERPEQLNVFTGGMGRELGAAYAAADSDDAVRAVVVTGAGRAFCAGADMRPEKASFSARTGGFHANPVDPPPWSIRKPVIAAVNGHAIGIGFTIAMQCDLRFVAAEAKLAIPQARRGVLGDAYSHWTVRHAASFAVAADILLTGRTFTGEEAGRLGLASRVLPAADVLPEAMDAARDIAVNVAPMSAALSKRLLWADADREEVGRLETAYHRLLMGSPDAAEGPRAWFERREPRWTLSVGEQWERVARFEAVEDADDAAAPAQAGS